MEIRPRTSEAGREPQRSQIFGMQKHLSGRFLEKESDPHKLSRCVDHGIAQDGLSPWLHQRRDPTIPQLKAVWPGSMTDGLPGQS